MKVINLIPLLFITLASAGVFAGSNNQELKIIKQQLANAHWHTIIDNKKWAYSVETLLDNGNGKVQQTKQSFDPNLQFENQWQLIEQDKQQPTPARLKLYEQAQQELIDEVIPKETQGTELVSLDSIKYKSSDSRFTYYEFLPNLPMFDKALNEVFIGEILFDEKSEQVFKLTIESKESFSPKVLFKIDKYRLEMTLKDINDELHLISTKSQKKGSALVFTKFSELSSREISNIYKVKTLPVVDN